MRRGLLQVAGDALERAVVVDERAFEVIREEVADDPERQLGLVVDEARRGRLLGPGLDLFPELLEEADVALDVLGGGALGRGAHDQPAFRQVELAQDVLQPRALVVIETARDADPFALRHVDDEAARERDLRRQPRALRLHRILDRLDENLLAACEQVLDAAAVPPALELGADDLVDVEEAVLLEPDLDERRLHPRQDVVDDALVDVARDRAPSRALEVDLGHDAVLEHGDRLLRDVDGDQKLALRFRQRRPRVCCLRRESEREPEPERRRDGFCSFVFRRPGGGSAETGGAPPFADVAVFLPRPRPPREPRLRLER